jgi:hypothetical protein
MQQPSNTLKNNLETKKSDTETVEEFKARGGKVRKIKAREPHAKPIPFNFMFSWRKRRK